MPIENPHKTSLAGQPAIVLIQEQH